ncbi:hypothetical protein Bca52824_004075 [Brassica carinata]|uniref:Uncharacterized protein n=1 Tax=Brassica carinata TaxID=52824 RepID=A0A8X7WPZ2_BRACI|nr:hypothetical protein Bca52824_004075 [Brassica carinata]
MGQLYSYSQPSSSAACGSARSCTEADANDGDSHIWKWCDVAVVEELRDTQQQLRMLKDQFFETDRRKSLGGIKHRVQRGDRLESQSSVDLDSPNELGSVAKLRLRTMGQLYSYSQPSSSSASLDITSLLEAEGQLYADQAESGYTMRSGMSLLKWRPRWRQPHLEMV